MSMDKRISRGSEIYQAFKRGDLNREEYRKFKILNALNIPNANMGVNQIQAIVKIRKSFIIAYLKEFLNKGIVFNNEAGKYSINPGKGVALLNDLKARINPTNWKKTPFYNTLVVPQYKEWPSDGSNQTLISSTVAWSQSWKEQAESRLDEEKTTESRIVDEVYPTLLEIFRDKIDNGPVKIELLIKKGE